MVHNNAAGFWTSLGLAMAALLMGPPGLGGPGWSTAVQKESGKGLESASLEQPAAPAQAIMEVLVTSESQGTRLVVVGDGEFGPHEVSFLREPPRIVLDLWGIQRHRADLKTIAPTREVERVRLGRHQDRMRLVADLSREYLDIPPYRVTGQGSRLVLSIGEVASQEEPLEPSLAGLRQRPRREDTPAVSQFPSRVWDPKEVDQKAQRSEDSAESPAPWPQVVQLAAHAPEAHNHGNQGVPEAAPPDPEGVPGRTSLPMVKEVDLTPSASGPLRQLTWQDAPLEMRKEGDVTFSSATAGSTQAFSMAQVAAKTRSKTTTLKATVPSPLLQDEEEEEFKISTGMEPGKTYSGQRLDLDLQDIDLDNVFRLLAEVSNLNIIVSEKVKGKVTMRLKDVPWDQALDLILSTQKLGMVRQGNVLRVAPLKDLVDEEKERKRLRQERIQAKIEAEKRLQEAEIEAQERERKLRPFVTEFIVLNYTKAKDFQAQIKDILTKEPKIERVGTAVVDDRTNTVTVTDYPEKVERIKRYKEQVDKPTAQVLIEARIVKASKNFARELGVQWGTQFAEFDRRGEWAWGISSATSTAGTTPPSSPSTWRSGAFSSGSGHDFFPLSGWMVNLPATILPGPPGIGFQIGRLAGDLINLDLRLSAAEKEGLTKIVSRPKVMTLDNVEATIKQGREIPFTQVNPEGNVSVVYKEASLKTTVTPQISPDGRVRLKLDVTDDFPDRANANPITGNPEIVKRQSTTEVLVRDGETVVIGGVLEETRATTEDGVPWLRDVPGLSWLFERKQRRLDQSELLIFVTPFIVQQT